MLEHALSLYPFLSLSTPSLPSSLSSFLPIVCASVHLSMRLPVRLNFLSGCRSVLFFSLSLSLSSAIGAEFLDLILDSPISQGDEARWKNCDMSTRTRHTALHHSSPPFRHRHRPPATAATAATVATVATAATAAANTRGGAPKRRAIEALQ